MLSNTLPRNSNLRDPLSSSSRSMIHLIDKQVMANTLKTDVKLLGKEYGILQVIPSHTQDVRSVHSYPNGGFLSASRDKTAKLYQPIDDKERLSELKEVRHFEGPVHFASSVCCGKNMSGETEIYVGSHDANIYIYSPDDSKHKEVLMRHSGPVSALAFRVCDNENVLLSGSWDNVAIIWKNRQPLISLYGHVHAIWSVAFVAKSFLLTAGADKTIRKWSISDGELLNVFEGHKDCVRGLAVITSNTFLSCSNDATINLWDINGNILKVFEGHDNFVYDICVVRELSKETDNEKPKVLSYKFVSVSEDKTVRIWDKELGCLQKIPLQATTLWSVAALDNANFVVGTSDGHSYIFAETTLELPLDNTLEEKDPTQKT